ncbi:low molecular weight phosphatase family protein [Thermoplasmatales archaeon SW_10_69_26]|nr:MAG: low molecular weight phosphatase family protein [Thermoplasmatales archaeon SW_10_69_26]
MSPEPVRLYFACVGNSARSQMAQAFCEEVGADHVECLSGGTDPLGRVREKALTVMDEIGLDLSDHASTPVDEEDLEAADAIATMGCGQAAMPVFEPYDVADWSLDHPDSLDEYRETRDEIRGRVRALLAEHEALAEDG